MPYIKQFQDEAKSCLSYYICCPGKSKSVVIDPSEDVEKYIRQSENDFSDICAIVDTHIHGDHLSGMRELSRRTGAPIYMFESSEVQFDFVPLKDGEGLDVGNTGLRVVSTPGHTVESICLLYIDHKRTESPWAVFSGDTLFVGDIGRLDFSGAGTVKQMYNSLYEKLLALPEYLELFPAHYIGSVCGKGMSLKTTSTIGFERKFNPALQSNSFEEFQEYLANNPLPSFPQHVQIKRTNSLALSVPIMRST